MNINKVFFILILLSVSFAKAGDLKSPFMFESAKVLPSGISNFRLNYINSFARNKLNADGEITELGNVFNKKVTWEDLIKGNENIVDKSVLEGYLLSKGINLYDEIGQTTGFINVDSKVFVPVFAYGLSSKWTIAMAMPVYKINVTVDTAFFANKNLQSFVGDTLVEDAKINKAKEIINKFQNPIADKVISNSYNKLQNQEKNEIGDLKLISKYQVYNNDSLAFSMKNTIVLPTGRTKDVNSLVDVSTGDEQVDLGLSAIMDYYFNHFISFSCNIGYLAQLPDMTTMRVPINNNSSISSDIDNEVKRDLGDQIEASFNIKYELIKGLNFQTAYNYLYKSRDKFDGDLFDKSRYALLSSNSEQELQSAQFAFSYSTLKLFKEKKFPVPLEAILNYSTILDGKNIVSDPMTSFELLMYF